jgi:anti-sigma28 factor (negative regulator of flagellin synthesis)
MQIYGPGGPDRSDPVFLRRLAQRLRAAGLSTGRKDDEVEISDIGRFLSYLSQLPQVRQEKVDALRREIESGSYDADSKIDEIIDSLLEDLGVHSNGRNG